MEKAIKNITKWVLVFLVIFVPFRELIANYTISYIKFLPDLMIWLLFIFTLIKNKFKLNLKIYDILYILFLFLGLISTLINHVSILAYCLQFRSITTMYILFYILRNIDIKKDDFKPTIRTLFIVNITIIIMAIIEFLTNKCIMYPEIWALSIQFESNFARAYSLLNNPNTFAIFIFMSMILELFYDKDKNSKIFLPYYILVYIGIFISASRSTMIVIGIYLVFLVWECFKEKKYNKLVKTILIIMISFGLTCGLGYIKNKMNYTCEIQTLRNNSSDHNKDENDSILEENNNKDDSIKDNNNSNNHSNNNSNNNINNNSNIMIDRWEETLSGDTLKNSLVNGRVFIIKKGLEIAADYPILGTGFGTYGSAASKMVYPKLYDKYDLYKNFYSDNDYIKILVETGILGCIVYAAFILSLLSSVYKNHYKLLMLLVYLTIGMFYNVSEMQVMCLILYISLVYFDKKE